MSETRRPRRTILPNRAGVDEASTVAPTLSDKPDQDKGVFPAAEAEVLMDAVVADRGGTAAVADLKEAEGDVLKQRGMGVLFWISVGWVALIIFLAVFASVIHLPDPRETTTAIRAGLFSPHHVLGTDQIGRDQLSRVIYGGRVSMTVGFASIFFGTL